MQQFETSRFDRNEMLCISACQDPTLTISRMHAIHAMGYGACTFHVGEICIECLDLCIDLCIVTHMYAYATHLLKWSYLVVVCILCFKICGHGISAWRNDRHMLVTLTA